MNPRVLNPLGNRLARNWTRVSTRFLPFADAATPELPLGRLLRLSLFQVSVGMAVVLLIGTLNRVMIVELGVPAWLVAVMISLPLVFAPFRAIVGFRSDTHRSVLGWRRVPYIWMGTLLQFGGLAIMPFALIVLSGDTTGPPIYGQIGGQIGAGLAFLLVGAGLHTTQTVGLALATDLAPPESHPRVVALLCMMLLLGMVGGALTYGSLLAHFSEIRLIQVVQGTALATMVLNVVALWKQEARNPSLTARDRVHPSFQQAWHNFSEAPHATRRLVALGLGSVAFSMQDILLEPYGGHVLHLAVGTTTLLSALLATGGLSGFGLAARRLGRGADPYRLAALGALIGLAAFSFVVFAAPTESLVLFAIGTALIGFSGGLFAHCTLTAAMGTARSGQIGLALGVWGAVQASAAGCAVAAGGLIRDGVSVLAEHGVLGQALAGPATGYSVVYHIEIALLFATLVAIGPLVRRASVEPRHQAAPDFDAPDFELGELPANMLSMPR
jgi:BCD family chlorophyll transporter-like MFS transporter